MREHSPPHIRGAKLDIFFRLANTSYCFFKEIVLYNIFSIQYKTLNHHLKA